MPVDVDYQENRPGGVPSHQNLLSVAKAEPIFISTQHSHGWLPSPTGEAARAVIASIELEELLEDAPVNDYSGASQECPRDGGQGSEVSEFYYFLYKTDGRHSPGRRSIPAPVIL